MKLTTGRLALIGAILGFAFRAWQYIGMIPEGAMFDTAGMVGFGLSGAFFGAILGGVVALIRDLFRKKT